MLTLPSGLPWAGLGLSLNGGGAVGGKPLRQHNTPLRTPPFLQCLCLSMSIFTTPSSDLRLNPRREYLS